MQQCAVWLAALLLGVVVRAAGGEGNSPVRFVVLGAGRTGSNLLVHTLREHPQVVVHGECFGGTAGHRQSEFLDR